MNTRNSQQNNDVYYEGVSTRNSQMVYVKPSQTTSTLQPGWINKIDKTRKVRKWKKIKISVGNYIVPRFVPVDKIPEIEEKMRMNLEVQKELKNAQVVNQQQIPLQNAQQQQIQIQNGQSQQQQQQSIPVKQNFGNQTTIPQQQQQQQHYNFVGQQNNLNFQMKK